MINKLQSLKGKTEVKLYQPIGNLDDENSYRRSNTFQFEEDPCSRNAESFSKNSDEILIFLKFLQIKPQLKSMKFFHHDLYYTVIKTEMIKKL